MQKIHQTSNGGFSASLIVSVAERTIINSPHISCSLYTYNGTLHIHRSVGMVRRDPTITSSSVSCSGLPLGLGYPVDTSAGSVSADSSSTVVTCCAATCLAGSASCNPSACGRWMQSASCSSSRRDSSSSGPEPSIRVRATMALFFSEHLNSDLAV